MIRYRLDVQGEENVKRSGDLLQVPIVVGDDRQLPVKQRQYQQTVRQPRLVALHTDAARFPGRLYVTAHRGSLLINSAMCRLTDDPLQTDAAHR